MNPANARLNLSYQYQNNGDISQITDATHSETLTYTYDDVDRLDTVSGPYSLNHDYNLIGNITTKGAPTYTYDANGNTPALHQAQCGASEPQRGEGGLTYTQTFNAYNLQLPQRPNLGMAF